jgi:type II secretory ATPase GspE/PulE/Tfp pilus assembly ATPase PilB-like protein
VISDEIARRIHRGEGESNIRAYFKDSSQNQKQQQSQESFHSMLDEGRVLILQGVTCVAEVLRSVRGSL